MPTCAAVPTRSSAASPSYGTLFDVAGKQQQLDDLNARMAAPGFWDNPDKAQQLIAQTKPLASVLKPYKELAAAAEDLRVLCELSEEDAGLEAELEPTLARMEHQLDDYELRSMLDGPQDASNAYLKIQAGTRGTRLSRGCAARTCRPASPPRAGRSAASTRMTPTP